MAGTVGSIAKQKRAPSPTERRVSTPNPDLVVVKIGKAPEKFKVSPENSAFGILTEVGRVMTKAGTDRARVFRSSSKHPVYAYFVFSKDPTKVVREDSSGQKTIGRFVGGRFRPTSAKGA